MWSSWCLGVLVVTLPELLMSDFLWAPRPEAVAAANITRFMKAHRIATLPDLHRRSVADVEWFWDAALKDLGVEWYQPYRQVLDKSKGMEWASWFLDGKLNVVHNCIDRHVEKLGAKAALIWEGDDGGSRTVTYSQLDGMIQRLAAWMRRQGVKPGDAVGIYMPMVPEIVAAFFACLKIGAVVVPVFSAFAAPALAVRLADAEAKILFTADGVSRRGKKSPLKPEADAAVSQVPSIRRVVVFERLGIDVPMTPGRDIKWSEIKDASSPTERLDAEAPSMILYTSGTTGKPKGTVHTHAGALAQMAKELGYA